MIITKFEIQITQNDYHNKAHTYKTCIIIIVLNNEFRILLVFVKTIPRHFMKTFHVYIFLI